MCNFADVNKNLSMDIGERDRDSKRLQAVNHHGLAGAELVCIFASPYTHPNDSIDMENREIYKAIKSIADELCSDGKTFLRADLAYELKKYGVAGDSSEVGSLVYDAYCFYGNDSNISIAFVTNNARTTIVADYKLNHCLEQGDMGDALAIAENELQATEHSLDKLQDMIALNLGAALAKGSSKADWLTGTSGVKEVRGKASVMFDRYAKLVEAYRYAGDSVRANISDFNSLRSDIEATYREYALRLIDLYGDSIKMVSPELFDFNQVEWLDVDQMLRQIELEYSKIQDKCGVLIAEIADSFRTSLQGSMSAYRSAAGSSKTLGLAMAGLGMLDHYMAASEKANRLCGDLQQLQTSVKHDATRIKADMGRLTVIYKTLNDVVIPKSNVYLRFASQLMDSDFRSMTDALYGEASVRPLEEERRELLRQMRSAEMEMNDHLQNIDVYQSLVGELTTTLEAKRPSYQDAKRRKPSKPFFLLNWLTLGTARRNYYRNYSEWDAVCTPLIREFDNMQVDLKLDREELLSHQEAAKATKSEHARLAARLDAVSREIRSKIVCSDELKLKMLKHLRDVVAMLKLGREIAESRLDEKLLRSVDITDFKETAKLPADVEQNLSEFTNLLADHLHADRHMAVRLLDGVEQVAGDIDNRLYGPTFRQEAQPPTYTDEELGMVEAKAEEVLQRGVALLDSVAQLKLQQLNGRIAAAAYDEQLDHYKKMFKGYLDKIDDKSAYLRQVFTRINLADSEQERKQAMEMLSDLSGYTLSMQDFNDFINGNKQIEL